MTRHLLCALLALSLASCGGSSNSGSENNGLFVGTFFVCSIDGLQTASIDVDSNFGTGVADGDGMFTGTTTQNDDGVVTGPFDFSFVYGIDTDRVTTFTGGIIQGAFNADGSVGALATAVANSEPQMLLIVKQSGTFDATSLNGDYRYGYWRRDMGTHISTMGIATFDGAGNWSATVEFTNTDGTVVNGGAESGTYAVAADGTVSLTFMGTANTLQGGLREDGEVAFLGGTTATGGFPAKMILIRSATTADAATFAGDYYVTGFSRLNGGGYSSIVGLINADGAGNVSFGFTTNVNGAAAVTDGTSGTSTTNPNGTLLFDVGTEMLGGISENGELAFLGGAVTDTSNPLLLFLIRR